LAARQGAGGDLAHLMVGGFLVLTAALLLDRFIGDPDWLWRRVPHPVALFGEALGIADRRFNRRADAPVTMRRNGFLAVLVLLLGAAGIGWAIEAALWRLGWAGLALQAIIVSVFLAQKSLADHVSAVALALKNDGLRGGRGAVSMIVGRNPEQLDEAGVCRAAIESLAENSSDGVAAPAFWFAVAGLPGLFAYKMLNTADSMIGHLNDKHRDFGRFAAKLDDAANWLPARLTGLLICAAAALTGGAAQGRAALDVMLRDARQHRSPNAGWPEAAMAGALGLALGGPRQYGADFVNEPVLNGAGRRCAEPADIFQALRHFWLTMSLLTLISGFLVLL
jgi:adenosylcobinamide-phosphate synthase